MDEIIIIKKFIIWLVCLVVILSIIGIAFNRFTRQIDTAVVQYEEYTEIYQTCQRINTDLCELRNLSEKDPMFVQFSKTQQTVTLKKQLNRWIEDYNAKSKMVNRSLWKSYQLPYQLSVNQFSCY